MRGKMVLVGGLVDARLKHLFLKELRKINWTNGMASNGKITQSKFLEMLLKESVARRKKSARSRRV
jgi:hypothetical protein